MKKYDVIVIGSGPAGLTAAMYLARADLDTLAIGGEVTGGQLLNTQLVENFPGFSKGVDGQKLMNEMSNQAKKFGAKIVNENAIKVDFSTNPLRVNTRNDSYLAKAVIIATGSSPKWLGVEGEDQLIGKGVSSCATCDAYFFKDKRVVVVGGGDSAMEEALTLAKFAKEVVIIHRKDKFSASKIMQDRVNKNAKIGVKFNSEVIKIYGDNFVKGVKIRDKQSSETEDFICDGVMVAIGHTPNTDLFLDQIKLEADGHISSHDGIHTSKEGIFVCGDVTDKKYKQAITSAGDGAKAALEVERYLINVKN